MSEISEFQEAARELAEELTDDIKLSKTREEHIRVTARANAATALHNSLLKFTEFNMPYESEENPDGPPSEEHPTSEKDSDGEDGGQ